MVKEQLLKEASEIIRLKGVHGFSFRTLADTCGIKSASVHYHFPNKKSLIHQILGDYVQVVSSSLVDLSNNESDPKTRLFNYIDQFMDWIKEGGYEKGCTALIIGSELSESDEDVRKMVDGLVNSHIKWIAETVKEGQDMGIFKPDTDSKQFATFLLLMLEGGSGVSKAICSGDMLKDGGSYAKSMVENITV